jgi:fido (protein-threonine AMPylation protein)
VCRTATSDTVAGPVHGPHLPQTDTQGRPLPPLSTLRGTPRRREGTSSAFLRAPGKTAAQTSIALGDALAAVLAKIAKDPPLSHPTVTAERLERWHRGVFGRLFRKDAGRMRRHDAVVFSNVYTDDAGTERTVLFNGMDGARVQEEVADACARFGGVQAAHAAGRVGLDTLAADLADLVADLLLIHPFVDGNHRVTLIAMQAVLRDVNGAITPLHDDVEALASDLELALLGPDYRSPLAERLARALGGAAPAA